MGSCVNSSGYRKPKAGGYGWKRAGVEVRDRIEVSPCFLNLKPVPYSLAAYSHAGG